MQLISSFTIIRAISIAHLTAAYFFLTAPKRVADQNVIFMLGESMRMQHVSSMEKPNESSAFIAVILAFIAFADLAAASLNELAAFEYWLANVPVRLFFLFVVTGYSYLFKEGGMLATGAKGKPGIGEPLQNSLVFSWGFFELAMWFWVFTSLRDERREVARRLFERRKAEEDME
ncbi:hypothetical protein K431DRAFT_317556 [Polychaeton citri CBS 116435]|uniref:Increased loss of mitochondrial DNA protein 1 n=1 Tax=Polychaeton citri CBS 116435 TaxID=1314669 RepID=A0A9P4QGX6_9PEZI|nr:hypothetical protein K431DRAFT_317556 [Polychaeton citri CBS 116435]